MHKENSTWGAKRIYDELCLLGYKDKVSKSSVKNYLKRLNKGPKGRKSNQSWFTFFKNFLHCTCACDFFTVSTINFKIIYCFVILSHDRRKIIHINVTEHPTLEWTKQQFREAFPFENKYKYLIRDRDGVYGPYFKYFIESFGMSDKMTSYKSPWQNCYCERVIGTLRRECTDLCFFRNETHLLAVLKEYVHYYNNIRPHRSLNGNAPDNRKPQKEKDGNVISIPILNGLHHHYIRKAA